jgi:bifunctional NMN adenylyltransferase/nudix hydrolase
MKKNKSRRFKMKKYDYAMIIGRFQPFHNAHKQMLDHALSLGESVIVVLGSSHSSPNIKNPFTAYQREQMIRACYDSDVQSRLIFAPIRDYPYQENLWIAEVQNIVNEYLEDTNKKMALVGHFKNETSYYLNLFPQWKMERFEGHEVKGVNATDIRNLYLSLPWNKSQEEIGKLVPVPVLNYLEENYKSNDYLALQKEYLFIEQYKKDSQFVGMNFPPTFVTTDAVVTALGHILVVRRGNALGKGKLALPGGFLAQNITLKENMLKELKEETNIKVPKQILESNIVDSKVFDHPHRSLRGRTITHVFHIHLTPNLEDGLPRVKGGDDADKAQWLSIADFLQKEEEFFEDHHSIAKSFLL